MGSLFLVAFVIFVPSTLPKITTTTDQTNVNEVPHDSWVKLNTQYVDKLSEELQNTRPIVGTPDICTKCELVMTYVITYRKSGANREAMHQYLSQLCILILGYIPHVCEVFSDIETDVILYIIDNKDVKAKEICGNYFQHKGCKNPYATNWTINIPPEVNEVSEEVKIDPSGGNALKIVQITDVHYDPTYKDGTNTKCNLPLCCEEKGGYPADLKNAAGIFGDYGWCDMSKNSIVNLLTEISNTHKDLDYVYFTGDIIAHKNWETSRESNLETIEEFYNFLFHYLGNVTVYPILGNHEAHPCNLFAPLTISHAEHVSTKWLFDAVAEHWSKWLPQSATETIKLGGYYSVLVRPGFRIIALNSNVCFTENFWLNYEDEDPYGQLEWMVQVLLEAEKNGERVHILSHVPPGEAMCHRRWQFNFNRIIRRFAKTISAHFNGHTHVDEFRIYKDERNPNQVINVAFNGGSFTTYHGLNPDYRVYDVNAQNLTVLDYHQYTFNLSMANSLKKMQWYKLYSFKSAYGLISTAYSSLSNLEKRLSSDLTLAKQYVKFHVRGSEHAFEKGCNETCIRSQICHISAINADDSIGCGEYTIFNI